MHIVISVKNIVPLDLRSWLEEQVRSTLQNAHILQEEAPSPLDIGQNITPLQEASRDRAPGSRVAQHYLHCAPGIGTCRVHGHHVLQSEELGPISRRHNHHLPVHSFATVDSQRAGRDARFVAQVQQQRIQAANEAERAEAERQNRMIQNVQKENAAAGRRLNDQIEQMHESQKEDFRKGRTDSFPPRASVSPYR